MTDLTTTVIRGMRIHEHDPVLSTSHHFQQVYVFLLDSMLQQRQDLPNTIKQIDHYLFQL